MKRFTVSCDFGDRRAPFHVYVGEPFPKKHPLQSQSQWLSRERNGFIPTEVMESFEKLHAIAEQHHISLAELSAYAYGSPTTLMANKHEDKLGHLRSEVQQFRETYEVLVETCGQRSKEGEAAGGPNGSTGPALDTLRRATPPETTIHIFETGKMLWPLSDEQSCVSRLLFLGLGLYIGSCAEKELTLGEIYHSLLSPDDVAYSFAIMLDTDGKRLPWLAYSLIGQWLYSEKWFREKTVFNMTTTLTDFALSAECINDSADMMRKGLYRSLSSGILNIV